MNNMNNMSNMNSLNSLNSMNSTEKAKSPDCLVFEDGSNQSTSNNKTRTYSLSSRKDELSIEEENHVEITQIIPYEKRLFPLEDSEFNDLIN